MSIKGINSKAELLNFLRNYMQEFDFQTITSSYGTINALTCSTLLVDDYNSDGEPSYAVIGDTNKLYFRTPTPTNNISIYGTDSQGRLSFNAPGTSEPGYNFSTSNVRILKDLEVVGTLTKGGGSFVIPHPVPGKEKTHTLWHSFVESPTAGDNLYRWQVEVSGGTTTIELPEYYSFLNADDMVWASPVGHFGAAYGEVSEDQKSLTIIANTDGKYNVLLIGTRKDDHVAATWEGVEREGAHAHFEIEDEDDSG